MWNVESNPFSIYELPRLLSLTLTQQTDLPCQRWGSSLFHFGHPWTSASPVSQGHAKSIYRSRTMHIVLLTPNGRAGKGCRWIRPTPACLPLSQVTVTHLHDTTSLTSSGYIQERDQVVYNVSLTGMAATLWLHFFFLSLLSPLVKWRQSLYTA